MKVITTLHFNRPQYTRRMLECLAAAEGIEDYALIAYVHEGGHPEVVKLLSGFTSAHRTFVVTEDLGIGHLDPDRRIAKATHQVLKLGFIVGEYVIHLEDDILLARDALRYFEYARQFEAEPECLTVSAYSKHGKPGTADPSAIGRLSWFHPWGWATWQSRWETLIEPNWGQEHWDEHLNRHRQQMYEIFPHAARALNVGATGGVHVPGAAWHMEHQFNGPWFVGITSVPFRDTQEPVIRPDG